jgi:WhiB family redox-sensing transcriptional regulator
MSEGRDVYELLHRPAWHRHAACRGCDPEMWFPERGESLGPARAICATCPVAAQCAEAGAFEKYGVWGGLSERQRRRLGTAA